MVMHFRKWHQAGLACIAIIATWLGLPVLAQAQATVEIQINKTDTTDDDYITWAPTACQARLQGAPAGGMPVAVKLKNGTGAVGQVCFEAMATPWPANKTATKETLDLSLPADGSW